MIRTWWAFSASILLVTFSASALGKNGSLSPSSPTSLETILPQETPAGPSNEKEPDEELGDLYMARKQYFEAAQIYKRVSDEHPRNAVLLNKLGIALHQQTELALALKYYERAAKIDPQYADVRNNIGTIWYERKNYRKAVKNYRKALALRSDLPVLHCNLGYAYFNQKKYKEAIDSFRQALLLDPQFFEHHASRTGSVLQDRSLTDRGLFYFLLAKSFGQSGDLERCKYYLRRSKDEGYGALAAAKSDPVFAQVLRDPVLREELTPKSAESAQP
jgi:tetratricopeptide (TPR) repeat protein